LVGDIGEAKTAAQGNYCGCYQSLADFAEEMTESSVEISDNLVDLDRR